MTIQEYIRIVVNGFPKEEFKYYRKYFVNMNCQYCMFNGYACTKPKDNGVCIEYNVKKEDLEFTKPGSHDKKI